MSLIYSQPPGLIAQPASALAAGNVLSSLPLSGIQSTADFANLAAEPFYQEVQDGGSLTLPTSFVDGYKFSGSECVCRWERKSTVSSLGGLPAASGGILEIADWVDPASLTASVYTPYMVQGGVTTPTNDGILAVWIYGIRGRPLITMPSGLSFAYQAESEFAKGQPLTQSLLRSLSASAQAGVVRCEVFTDAGQGTTWSPGWTPAAYGYSKPTWGHANGCYYQAAEVIAPTGIFEPTWPTAIGASVVDGGVIWICVGRGFSNGQQFSMPTSPTDGHVYTSAEMVCCLTSWITTGKADLSGPSGSGRIQRLQKSAPAGLVSTAVTYWDGSNQDPTTDGVVHCVGIFQRALPAYAAVPPAYYVFDGDEFMSGEGLCATKTGQTKNNGQLLADNVNNAALRPEVFWSTGKTNSQAVPVPTSWGGHVYSRSECMDIYELTDTGAVAAGVDYAIRLFTTLIDPASGQLTLRTDYYQGGAPVYTNNGVLNIACTARLAENVELGEIAIIGLGGSPGIAPPNVNAVENGSFDIWNNLLIANGQAVAHYANGVFSLAGWDEGDNTVDGYITQQPGIDSQYSVGLNVGNSHTVAYNQWVSVISKGIPFNPGDLYSWSILAASSAFNQSSGWLLGLLGFFYSVGSPAAITAGFIVRLHFLDDNFSNDVSFDLIPNQGLAGSPATKFGFQFTMPQAGDTVLQTQKGPLSINGGAVPANVTYCRFELWNWKPNITSTIICDDLKLLDIQGSIDAVSPVNTAQSLDVNATLSQSGTSTLIDIAASTLSTPYQQVAYGIGSVGPGAYGTFYIYADDPKFMGGSVTYQATKNKSDLTAAPGRVRFGSIMTIPAGGGSGGGGGGGGTALVIEDQNIPDGTHGIAYSYQLTAYGGVTPYTWSVPSGSIPSGLTVSGSGLISGTPSSPGDYSFTVKATDSSSPAQTATQMLILSVY